MCGVALPLSVCQGRLELDSETFVKIADYSRRIVELPRPLKRLITLCADAVMIPGSLWAAISLRDGTPASNTGDWPAYVAVVVISLPIFIRLGLYRAVIRFLGHKAVFAVAFAV